MIYIVMHDDCKYPHLEGYKPMKVGRVFSGSLDNINDLNPYLNETTALYSLWKHCTDDIVGLVHYRRFFVKDGTFLKYEDAQELLQYYDIIVTRDHYPLQTTPYYNLVNDADLELVDKYLAMCPPEVLPWFYSPNSFNVCNMFVARRKIINEYCEWLFPMILPMAQRFIREDVSDDKHRNRALGYLVERLFGYWCKDLNRYGMEMRYVWDIK